MFVVQILISIFGSMLVYRIITSSMKSGLWIDGCFLIGALFFIFKEQVEVFIGIFLGTLIGARQFFYFSAQKKAEIEFVLMVEQIFLDLKMGLSIKRSLVLQLPKEECQTHRRKVVQQCLAAIEPALSEDLVPNSMSKTQNSTNKEQQLDNRCSSFDRMMQGNFARIKRAHNGESPPITTIESILKDIKLRMSFRHRSRALSQQAVIQMSMMVLFILIVDVLYWRIDRAIAPLSILFGCNIWFLLGLVVFVMAQRSFKWKV